MTGIDPLAVHMNGAGATFAVIAALFRAGQRQAFAQGVEQGHPRFDRQPMFHPVHFQGDVHDVFEFRTHCLNGRCLLRAARQ